MNKQNEQKNNLSKTFSRIVVGGIANLISTIITLPLFKMWTTLQKKDNRLTMKQIAQNVFTKKGLKEVYFIGPIASWYAVTQSITYLGTVNVIKEQLNSKENDCQQPLPQWEIALIAGSLAGTTESITTSELYAPILAKLEKYKVTQSFAAFQRRLFYSLIKNMAANTGTVGGYFLGKYILKFIFRENNVATDFSAGLFGAWIFSPFYMPLVTLQTRGYNNIEKSIFFHTIELWKGGYIKACSGLVPRGVQKSIQAAIAFTILGYFNRYLNNKENPPSPPVLLSDVATTKTLSPNIVKVSKNFSPYSVTLFHRISITSFQTQRDRVAKYPTYSMTMTQS